MKKKNRSKWDGRRRPIVSQRRRRSVEDTLPSFSYRPSADEVLRVAHRVRYAHPPENPKRSAIAACLKPKGGYRLISFQIGKNEGQGDVVSLPLEYGVVQELSLDEFAGLEIPPPVRQQLYKARGQKDPRAYILQVAEAE
ncbi:MAG: hypothetical protein JSW08_01400 [archaeon]|nr:MAG: hypothetical protein JSW08_01400 [archaeon]